MTTAVNPGLWYRSLVNYKNGVLDDHTLVAAVISSSVAAHGDRIAELLGGELQRVVVVPSTRGRPFDSYPLARAVRRIKDLGDLLTNSLSHVQGETIQRQEYKPSLYSVDPSSIRHRRVLLIEDLWVSGARAISAAGALLEAQASSVVVLPIAREIRGPSEYCPQEYLDYTAVPFDVDSWPR
jgi:predicted amidophosphoribosyltransferase